MEGRASILSKEAFFLNLAIVAIEYKVGIGTVEVEMIGCRIPSRASRGNWKCFCCSISLLLVPWCLRQQERERKREREKENHI